MEKTQDGNVSIMDVNGDAVEVQVRMSKLGSVVSKLEHSHGHLVGDYLISDAQVQSEFMVFIWTSGYVLKYNEGILDVVLFLGFMLDMIDCGLV
jgi:hypothetical protein